MIGLGSDKNVIRGDSDMKNMLMFWERTRRHRVLEGKKLTETFPPRNASKEMQLKCWIRPQTAVFDNVGPHISANKLAIWVAHVFFAGHEVLGVDVRSVS